MNVPAFHNSWLAVETQETPRRGRHDSSNDTGFCFVVTQGLKTQREKELEDSKRRAHASRVVHLRKGNGHGRQRKKTATPKTRDKQHASRQRKKTSGAVALEEPASPPVFLGDSDPFDSVGVKITPQMNLVISFMRDCFLPALYFSPFVRTCSIDAPKKLSITKPDSVISGPVGSKNWNNMVWSLHDEGLGLARLAAGCALLPQLREVTSELSEIMRAKSISLLRKRLETEGESFCRTRAGIMQVFWLFEAEAMHSNEGAARIHGKALRDTVMKSFDSGVIDIVNLVHFLWVDTDLAARSMRRTVFSMEWVSERLGKIWEYYKKKMPIPSPPIHLDLDATVAGQTLRDIMIELRLQILMVKNKFTADQCKELAVGDVVFVWISSKTLVDYGRLTNHFLDLDEEVPADTEATPGYKNTQKSLTLAAMLILRCLHPLHINGVDIRDTSPTIMSRMMPAMVSALSECTVDERMRYAHAHLWTLYVAAVVERRHVLEQRHKNGADAPAITFGKLVLDQAIFSRITTWPALRAVESRFIQTEKLQPSGSIWFEDAFRQHRPTQIKQ